MRTATLCSHPRVAATEHAATEHAAAALDARDELGTLLFDAGYASTDTLAAPGPDQLIALSKTHPVHAATTTGPPPPHATPRQAMDHRPRTPQGTALNTRRGTTDESGIGNIKKLLDRYSRHGLAAVTNQTHPAATAFNLPKIHRAAHP
ncbi:MAG: transposase [Actinomycetota bacterium]|nr:transposase [Actinomycetota bacterium]